MNELDNELLEKPKKEKKLYKSTIVFIIIDLCALICFGIVYFIPSFKTMIVTTALRIFGLYIL